MKRFLTLTAIALCLVACKKEGNGSGKGYTKDDLGSTSWQGSAQTETTDEIRELNCTLQLWEDGKADLNYTYSMESKSFFLDKYQLEGTWSLKKGKLALRFDKETYGNIKDLPWNLTGKFLDDPTADPQRMTLEIPDKGSVLLIRKKLTKYTELPLEPSGPEGE